MFHFSYVQEEYDEVKELGKRYLSWKNKESVWEYSDCKVKVISMEGSKARIIVRRKKSGYSEFMQSDFEVNLMLGFIALDVQKVTDKDGKNISLLFDLEQSNDKKHRDLKEVKIWSEDKQETEDLYNTILHEKGNNSSTKIIETENIEKNDSMMPVVYQPKIDAWENFLREIHAHKKEDGSFEITLAFQDEVLRKHRILDEIYRIIRRIKYKRTVDIETFTFKDGQFFFGDIYSGESNLFEDTVHNEKVIAAKYYFQDKNHPVIFVNTSNHALAPHDNNHDMWKWEYIPWSKKIPIKSGSKTREQVDKSFQ